MNVLSAFPFFVTQSLRTMTSLQITLFCTYRLDRSHVIAIYCDNLNANFLQYIPQALKEDITSHKPERDTLVNLAKELNTTAEIDQAVVDKEAENLAKRYDDLMVDLEDKEGRLGRLIAKSEKYHAALAPVEELFTKVEQAVNKSSPFGADVEQAEGELEIVKVKLGDFQYVG